MRAEALQQVGPVDLDADHFELDLAERYSAAGWTSAFFDLTTCVHLGPKTFETGPGRAQNAYDLSGRPQFGRPPRVEPPSTVRLMPQWTTAEELARQWARQSPAGDLRWGGIQLVADGDADLTLVVNHPGPGDPEPDPSTTIVVQMEPQRAVRGWGPWADPDPNQYLQVRSPARYGNIAEWHLARTWSQLHEDAPPKTAGLSAVMSGLKQDPGHRLRIRLVHGLQAAGVPIDVYGRDNERRFRDHRGPLPRHDKSDGILPYRYTLAVENHAEPGYFTEKLVDALVAECLPLYWGCPDLEAYLPPDSFLRLPLEDRDASVALVAQIVSSDERERRLPAIREAKRLLLDDLQVLPTVARVAAGAEFVDQLDIRVINLDRRPDRWTAFIPRMQAKAGPAFTARCARVSAVDGQQLSMTPELAHRFRGNDFGYRRGMVGCALSHTARWEEVAATGRPALVLEDDVLPGEDFRGRLIEVSGRLQEMGTSWDVVLLGWARWPGSDDDPLSRVGPPRLRPMAWPEYLGGTAGYLISPAGARHLLAAADQHGITYGIDRFLQHQARHGRVLEAVPHLLHAEVAVRGSGVDSDIQWDASTL